MLSKRGKSFYRNWSKNFGYFFKLLYKLILEFQDQTKNDMKQSDLGKSLDPTLQHGKKEQVKKKTLLAVDGTGSPPPPHPPTQAKILPVKTETGKRNR